MEDGRGASRGRGRAAAGAQAQQAAMYTFQTAQQVELTSAPQKTRTKLSAVSCRSTSFAVTGSQLPPGEGQRGPTLNSVFPAPSPTGLGPASPRPISGGIGVGSGPVVACANIYGIGEPSSRRSLDLDRSPPGYGGGPGSGRPGSEGHHYYRSNRILHPWDLMGGGMGTELGKAAAALVVTNGAGITSGAVSPGTPAAPATPAAAARPGSSNGRALPRIDPMQQQQQPHQHLSEGRAGEGSAPDGPVFSVRTPEQGRLVARPRRSFERDPPQHPSLDLPPRGVARMALPSSNVGPGCAEQSWMARAEGAAGQPQIGTVAAGTAVPVEPPPSNGPGGDAPGVNTATAAAAPLSRPAAAGRIPQPSSLYGASPATLLGKLPPTRGNPRRGVTGTPRASSNGSFQASLQQQQLRLAPHTQAAAAAAALALVTGTSDADSVDSAPPSPTRAARPMSANGAWTTAPGTAAAVGLGAAEGGAAAAAGGGPGGVLMGSPQTAALLEAQRAGHNLTIEQILLSTGAAPRSLAAPSAPRPDSQALHSMQQAFRAMCANQASVPVPAPGPGSCGKMSKTANPTATREDVWELQTALLRQVSQLAAAAAIGAAPPTLVSSPSPSTPPFAIVATGPTGPRNTGGRHIAQLGVPSVAAMAAAVCGPCSGRSSPSPSLYPTLPAEASRRAIAVDNSRCTAAEGGLRSPPSEASLSTLSVGPSPAGAGASASAAGLAMWGPPAGVAPFSPEDVAFQPLLGRDAEGFVAEGLITAQESALTSALTGVVVQVGVSCVERAHLLHSLWASLRQLMAAVIQDRETARSQLSALRRDTAAASSQSAVEIDSLRESVASLTEEAERAAAREREQALQLAAAHQELQKLRQVVTDGAIESLSAKLREAQDDREAARQEVAKLQARAKDLESELYDARQDQAMASARASALESQAAALSVEVRSRTPRPSRSLGMLDDLLQKLSQEAPQTGSSSEHTAEQGQGAGGRYRAAVLAALSAGAVPLEMHRLMLGINNEGEDMSGWAAAFGCVREVVPEWSDAATHAAATAPPPDAAAGLASVVVPASGGGGGGGGAAGGSVVFRQHRSTTFAGAAPAVGAGVAAGAAAAAAGPSPRTANAGTVGAGPGCSQLRRGVSFTQHLASAPGSGGSGVGTCSTRSSGTGGAPDAYAEPPLGLRLPSIGEQAAGGQNVGGESGSSVRATVGSLGGASTGGGFGATRRQTLVMAQQQLLQQQAYMRRLHSWLVDLIEEGDVDAVRRLLPEQALEAIGQALHLGVSPGGIAAWLLGSLAPGGFNFAPYKELVGLLSHHFSHTPHDLGGPVTAGLELAAMSTVARMQVLQVKTQELHREVVRLKRSVAEHKRAERARALVEVDAIERRNSHRHRDRPPNPVRELLAAKWGDFFPGLGFGANVPKVLRAEGKVYNRRMEKVDAEKMVHAIWAAKDEWQQAQAQAGAISRGASGLSPSPSVSSSPGVRLTLEDFLAIYLQRKYTNPRSVTETAYNLVYTLGQHAYDPDCNLFVRVLQGDVGEGIRGDEQELQADLVAMLTVLDRATHGGRATGYLAKRDMAVALRGFFPAKAAARFEEVLEALETDCPGSEVVQYRRLFDVDGDLNQGVFAETIRNQLMHERLELMKAIEDALQDAADMARVHHVAPSLLASVLRSTVPDCTEASVGQYLLIVYGNDEAVRAAEAAAPVANAAFMRAAKAAAQANGGSGGAGGGQGGAVPGSRAGAGAGATQAVPLPLPLALVSLGRHAGGSASPRGGSPRPMSGSPRPRSGSPRPRSGSPRVAPAGFSLSPRAGAAGAGAGGNGTAAPTPIEPPGNPRSVSVSAVASSPAAAERLPRESVAQRSVPSVAEVMALIRRGWLPQLPSIAALIESLSAGAALKVKLQLSLYDQRGRGRGESFASAPNQGLEASPRSPRGVSWVAALGQTDGEAAAAAPGLENGGEGGTGGGTGSGGGCITRPPRRSTVGSGDSGPGPSGSSGPALRVALKRLRYLHVMSVVRDVWLKDEQDRVRQVVQLAAAPAGKGTGAGAGRRDSAALNGMNSPRAGSSSGGVSKAGTAEGGGFFKISSLASLPTAADFAEEEEPEVAALEAAQRILVSQLAIATAGGGGSSTSQATASARHNVSFISSASSGGGADPMTPRLSRAVGFSVAGSGGAASGGGGGGGAILASGPAAAAVVLADAGDRLARLRALGGLMSALAEDRPDAPAAGLDPELRRCLYHGHDPLADSSASAGAAVSGQGGGERGRGAGGLEGKGEDLGAAGE